MVDCLPSMPYILGYHAQHHTNQARQHTAVIPSTLEAAEAGGSEIGSVVLGYTRSLRPAGEMLTPKGKKEENKKGREEQREGWIGRKRSRK